MTPFNSGFLKSRAYLFLCFTAAILLAVSVPIQAGDLDKLDASLKFIPDDAAFYSTGLHYREQFEALLKSNAAAKLQNLPVTQMGLAIYNIYSLNPETPVGQLRAALENPEVKEIVQLGLDMLSDEVFVYGEENCVDLLRLFKKVNSANQFSPLYQIIETGDFNVYESEKFKMRLMTETLASNVELITVPNVLFGFNVRDAKKASETVEKLQAELQTLIGAEPALKDAMKKEKIDGREFLVLRLTGKMIPWDELPLDQWKAECSEEQVAELVDHLTESDVVIAFGLRENYVLVSIGSSLDCLESFGAENRLIDLPAFKPLGKFADKKIVGISYASEDFLRLANDPMSGLDEMIETVEKLLPKSSLSEEEQQKIIGEANGFLEDVKKWVPQPDEAVVVQFWTEKGYEGYCYGGYADPAMDSTKKLSMLDHLGGDPLFAAVNRTKNDPEVFATLVKWIKVGFGYFEQYAVVQMPQDEKAKYQAFMKDAMPLFAKLETSLRTKLIPALSEGQLGIVFDAKLKTKQPHVELTLETAVPLPEMAILVGVTDAKLLVEGAKDVYNVADGLLGVFRKIEPEAIPDDFKLPLPEEKKESAGTIYAYLLPEAAGVDKNIALNFGVSSNLAVISDSPQFSLKLLKETPLKPQGVLADTQKPRYAAVTLRWADFIEATKPWLDFLVVLAVENSPSLTPEYVGDQVHGVAEVLQCLKTVSVEMYLEDGKCVTHSVTEIHDTAE